MFQRRPDILTNAMPALEDSCAKQNICTSHTDALELMFSKALRSRVRRYTCSGDQNTFIASVISPIQIHIQIKPYSRRALKGSVLGGGGLTRPPPSDLENNAS